MIFNVIVLVCVIVVILRHERRKANEMMFDKKSLVRLVVSIGGIMFIFGLTWLFAILSFASVRGLRETFQILFTVSNSLQGMFIFLFICIISSDVRDEWKMIFTHTKLKSWINRHHSSTKITTVKMLETNMDNI